jgi:hypothetical protein
VDVAKVTWVAVSAVPAVAQMCPMAFGLTVVFRTNVVPLKIPSPLPTVSAPAGPVFTMTEFGSAVYFESGWSTMLVFASPSTWKWIPKRLSEPRSLKISGESQPSLFRSDCPWSAIMKSPPPSWTNARIAPFSESEKRTFGSGTMKTS